jgi:N-acetylneuraminic acid mutarotase
MKTKTHVVGCNVRLVVGIVSLVSLLVPELRSDCTNDTWSAVTMTNAPVARYWHTVVWTGSEMIVWGGIDNNGQFVNTGARYNPNTDTWVPTSTINAPSPRVKHTAVWTGTEMLVWGGEAGAPLNSGARYNPTTDTWTPITSINAPAVRTRHTAVWTGSEMIVWGGVGAYVPVGTASLSTGGRYNPSTDTWTATNTINAAQARGGHTAVWTGQEMIVWGGDDGFNIFDTGGRYNPALDQWTAISTTNAPEARVGHTAVWTGSEMTVWGGTSCCQYLNTGARYNPAVDTWTPTDAASAPSGRAEHTAIWTGSEMIVWGGAGQCAGYCGDGMKYNPNSDSWTPISMINAPAARSRHTAAWSGSQMIIWGGNISTGITGDGGRYCGAGTAPPAHQYSAQVQQPINANGTSVFNDKRGVVPVKFTLSDFGTSTCALPPATIAVTRTAGGTTGAVNESVYSMAADSGSNFKIAGCQYAYNLSGSMLGPGTYRVDIKIDNQVVGSAVFQLK